MNLDLDGRVVLVTGASSGVGLATVARLVGEGASVATCARDGARLKANLDGAGLPAERILAEPCDVRDAGAVERLVGKVSDRFGRLDGLVNNAGESKMKPLGELTPEDWRTELDLKFFSVLNPTLSALALLRQAPAPAVVNINAVLAVQPESHMVNTSAARAGVLNLSRSLADELAKDGIRVNSVCLGLIDTGLWRRRHAASGLSINYQQWQAELAADRHIPLGRVGTAEEVANVVTFLLSPAASYVTGAAVDVAGGVNRSIH